MTTRPDDDCGLIAATRSGDLEAFDQLVRRYQDRLFATLHRLTGRQEDARDLVQEAFFRAYRKLGRFHGESGFYTWIYRIAVNLALSDRRKVRPSLRLSLDTLDPIDPSSSEGPGESLEAAERHAMIHAALQTLPPDHRAVVVMNHFDGLRYEEIAKVLGVPVGTVRSRLHRARVELRERLRPVLDLEPAHASSRMESSPS